MDEDSEVILYFGIAVFVILILIIIIYYFWKRYFKFYSISKCWIKKKAVSSPDIHTIEDNALPSSSIVSILEPENSDTVINIDLKHVPPETAIQYISEVEKLNLLYSQSTVYRNHVSISENFETVTNISNSSSSNGKNKLSYKDALVANKNRNNIITLRQNANNENKRRRKTNRKNNQLSKFPYLYDFNQKILVIAADATPRHIGGYCINQFNKAVQYYSTPSTNLPWILRNRTRSGNPNEFEMKNLLCALLLWENLILNYRKVAIFTDNSAISGENEYGSRVRAYINHLIICGGVLHVNPDCTYVYDSNESSAEYFDRFIVPADQLSRNRENAFLSHMKSHKLWDNELKEKDIIEKKFYLICQKVRQWTRYPCAGCGFQIPKTGSMKKYFKTNATRNH